MANRTVKDAHSIHGTNPQYLVEKIIRTRIYESKYWKEECFGLTGKQERADPLWTVLWPVSPDSASRTNSGGGTGEVYVSHPEKFERLFCVLTCLER